MTESSQLEGHYQRVLPKVTKMGSIISHTIDYNGVGVLKGQRQMPHKNWLKQPLNLSYIFSSTGGFGVTIMTACPEIDQPQIRKSAKIILIWPRQRNSCYPVVFSLLLLWQLVRALPNMIRDVACIRVQSTAYQCNKMPLSLFQNS